MRLKLFLAALLAMDVAVVGWGPRADQPTLFRLLRAPRQEPPPHPVALAPPPRPPTRGTWTTFHLRRIAAQLGMASLGRCTGVWEVTACSQQVGAGTVAVALTPRRGMTSISWRHLFPDSMAAVEARDSLASALFPGETQEACELGHDLTSLRALHWLTFDGIAVRFELRRASPGYQLSLHGEGLEYWPAEARCSPALRPRVPPAPPAACPAPNSLRFYLLGAPKTDPRPRSGPPLNPSPGVHGAAPSNSRSSARGELEGAVPED